MSRSSHSAISATLLPTLVMLLALLHAPVVLGETGCGLLALAGLVQPCFSDPDFPSAACCSGIQQAKSLGCFTATEGGLSSGVSTDFRRMVRRSCQLCAGPSQQPSGCPQDGSPVAESPPLPTPPTDKTSPATPPILRGPVKGQDAIPPLPQPTCNLTTGRWIDKHWMPRYDSAQCTYIRDYSGGSDDCVTNGRSPRFLSYSFRPWGCNINMFSARQFLSLMRDKTVAFVGDSIVNRNLFPPLLCMLARVERLQTQVVAASNLAGPPLTAAEQAVMQASGKQMLSVFYAPRRNVRLLSLWSPFLVRFTGSDPNQDISNCTQFTCTPNSAQRFRVSVQEPDPLWSSLLPQLNVLFLESGHWWALGGRTFVGKNGAEIAFPDPAEAHRVGMQTVRDFVMNPVNGFRGIPFFMTLPPRHYGSAAPPPGGMGFLNPGRGPVCNALGPTSSAATASYYMTMWGQTMLKFYRAQKQVFQPAASRFRFLDIFGMTALRPDGHLGVLLNATREDCLHWCTPGVPDQWLDNWYYMLRWESTLISG